MLVALQESGDADADASLDADQAPHQEHKKQAAAGSKVPGQIRYTQRDVAAWREGGKEQILPPRPGAKQQVGCRRVGKLLLSVQARIDERSLCVPLHKSRLISEPRQEHILPRDHTAECCIVYKFPPACTMRLYTGGHAC